MENNNTASYHITHENISEITGLELDYVRRKSSTFARALNKYRISGHKGTKLYNQDGLKVWEYIAQLYRQGKAPAEIRVSLTSTFESLETLETTQEEELHAAEIFSVGAGKKEKQGRGLSQDNSSFYQALWQQENKRIEDLKEAHKRELGAKDETIGILMDQVNKKDTLLLTTSKKTSLWDRIRGKQE